MGNYYQQLNCYFKIGTAYTKLNRNERAVYPLSRCCEMMPKNERYLLERGKVYQSLQMFEEAAKDYTEVIKVNSNNS